MWDSAVSILRGVAPIRWLWIFSAWSTTRELLWKFVSNALAQRKVRASGSDGQSQAQPREIFWLVTDGECPAACLRSSRKPNLNNILSVHFLCQVMPGLANRSSENLVQRDVGYWLHIAASSWKGEEQSSLPAALSAKTLEIWQAGKLFILGGVDTFILQVQLEQCINTYEYIFGTNINKHQLTCSMNGVFTTSFWLYLVCFCRLWLVTKGTGTCLESGFLSGQKWFLSVLSHSLEPLFWRRARRS